VSDDLTASAPTATGPATLDARARRTVAEIWAARSASEAQAGGVLARVAADLRALGAPESLAVVADRSVTEEASHAAVCQEVAAAYDPAVTIEARLPVQDFHPGEDPRVTRWRHVVGFCCISETFASSFLNDCRTRADAPIARQALRALLADEIDHARLGWAFLASRAAPPREEIAAGLVPLLAAYRDHLRERAARLPALDLSAHGCPHPDGLLPLFRLTLDQLVLPGFASAGVDTAAAAAWVAAPATWA
jgi:hypothetical protein